MSEAVKDIIIFILTKFSPPVLAFFLGGLVVFKNPETVQVWLAKFYWLLSKLSKKYKEKATKNELEGHINRFAKDLSTKIVDHDPVGVKIVWVDDQKTKEQFFEDDELIIKMIDTGNNNKNFVHATMAFVSKTMLPRAKMYISKSQKESVDLYIVKKLFEAEKPQISEQFFKDFFSPKIEAREKIAELIEKYSIIDRAGLFYPIFLNELVYLGQKVFYKRKDKDIIAEVSALVRFLQTWSLRILGDTSIPNIFEGAYCSCAVVIVGIKPNRIRKEERVYVNYIKELVNRKVDNIYLLGPAQDGNDEFIEQIGNAVTDKFSYHKTYTKQYTATIESKDGPKEQITYLTLHRNAEAVSYLSEAYQQEHVSPYVKENYVKGLGNK